MLGYKKGEKTSDEATTLKNFIAGTPVVTPGRLLENIDVEDIIPVRSDLSAKQCFERMNTTMENIFESYGKSIDNPSQIASLEEVVKRYVSGKKSFSVIAPCAERSTLRIVHGSHRFRYTLGTAGEEQLVHRCLSTEISVPEQCMIILDENLLHAGTGSMIAGYTPTHTPRYFRYLHHKDILLYSDFSFNKFRLCSEGCKFCEDVDVKRNIDQLMLNFGMLEDNGVALASRVKRNDWVAGDMISLGWVIVGNGISTEDSLRTHVAHDLQTLLLTTKFLKAKPNSSWAVIDSNQNIKDNVIPGSFRSYNYENETEVRKGACLVYGKRKMIPYLPSPYACHLDWFKTHGCTAIAEFFEKLEKCWTGDVEVAVDGEKIRMDTNLLSNAIDAGNHVFKDYKFSGQCIIANFGFVREQKIYMDFLPIAYD